MRSSWTALIVAYSLSDPHLCEPAVSLTRGEGTEEPTVVGEQAGGEKQGAMGPRLAARPQVELIAAHCDGWW
jgi:hypothetical protein